MDKKKCFFSFQNMNPNSVGFSYGLADWLYGIEDYVICEGDTSMWRSVTKMS